MAIKGKTYTVTYSVTGTSRPYTGGISSVFISEEYGTTYDDIPKLVAIPRGLRPENIILKSVIQEGADMITVTFELFNDEMFLEMEIETSDLDSTLSLLESIPNARNIKY